MQFTTLSKLIRQSFEDEMRNGARLPGLIAEPLLAGLDAHAIARALRNPREGLDHQSAVLAAAIACYRRAPTPAWSAVLLEMLAPMLVASSSRFPYVPSGVTEEDVQQQVIVEALHAARFMPLPDEPRYTGRRLRNMVVSRTARMLQRAARSEHESLELMDQVGPSRYDADQVLLMNLREMGVPRDDLALLYRCQVLGMTVRELAIEIGSSMSTVRARQRRALRHLRKALPAEKQRPPIEKAAAA
jgi:DNA-directed RNA polymerase specialized sigma24 family protein